MATASPWKDIDDRFCLCSICLEHLKEPKLLPCLHRYCKDCLSSIIRRSYDAIICPECREEIQIPSNGADGFKTDFYSKSLVEYVQIQRSLKSNEIRECYSCSKHLKVAAYCFKCNDFLCRDCHYVHITNKTLKDHQKHTLSFADIEAKNITIEKLASMRDAPRCHIHLDEIAKLFCETCGNLPICVACVHGEHKECNLHEVTALAKLKRKQLTQKLRALEEINKDQNLTGPRTVNEELILNVSIEKEKVIKMYHEKDQEIMTKIQDTERERKQVEQEKQITERKMFDSLQTEMEHQIQRVRKKYKDIFREKKLILYDSFKVREISLEKELANLVEQRERCEKDKKELLESIEKQQNENMKIVETMSQYFDNIKKRFETLHVMASSILASDNDWSAVECIPDMCTAATNLMKDLKKDLREVTTLTDVTVNCKQFSPEKSNVTKISENFERMMISIHGQGKYLHSVTSSGNGEIVISGSQRSGAMASFITVIDKSGWILKEKIIRAEGFHGPIRYCKFLSQHKVASVCELGEIGLYDTRDDSYIKKNISGISSSISCVATDLVNNHILVGGLHSRDVYVFDDQLNYLYTLKLPEMIKWPQDMTVSDGHLLVCDLDGKKCYLTTMYGFESKLVGEFMKPNLEGNRSTPISACSDKVGFIYVLWKSYTHAQYPKQCYLAQYNHDDSQVLTTRKLDRDAHAVTVVETSQGEKLLVATHDAQRVYLFDLMTKD